MAWVPIAAAVAGSVASSAMNNSGKGSSSDPGGGYSLSQWEKMPQWAQDKYSSSMMNMPSTTNVNFGGASYPSVYGPFNRAATNVFKPAGATQMGQSQPSGLAGGLASAAPWMWMAANNQSMYNFNQQQAPMGQWSNQTPYGSAASYSTGYPYSSDYMPGWNYQSTGF